jgi:hypothetical protein
VYKGYKWQYLAGASRPTCVPHEYPHVHPISTSVPAHAGRSRCSEDAGGAGHIVLTAMRCAGMLHVAGRCVLQVAHVAGRTCCMLTKECIVQQVVLSCGVLRVPAAFVMHATNTICSGHAYRGPLLTRERTRLHPARQPRAAGMH